MGLGRLTIVWMLASCGRIGFDGQPDGAAGPGTIAVTVRHTHGDTMPGVVVADAYVVADPGGALVVARTDAAGQAQVDVPGTSSITVAYDGGATWFVTTFEGVMPGTSLVVGEDLPLPRVGSVTANLPALAGATSYTLAGSTACLDASTVAQPTVTTTFTQPCDGGPHTILALATDANGALGVLSLGAVTLVDNAMLSPAGPWNTPTSYSVNYSNLPLGTLTTALAAEADGGVLPLAGTTQAVAGDGTASLSFGGFPLTGPGLVVTIDALPTEPLGMLRVDRVTPGTVFAFQNQASIPSIAVDPAADRVAISADAGATLLAAAVSITVGTTPVVWVVYTNTPALTYPRLPPELVAITPAGAGTWSQPGVGTVRSSALAYADLIPHIDPGLPAWTTALLGLPPGDLVIAAAPYFMPRLLPHHSQAPARSF